MLLVHQLGLSRLGLSEFILHAPRQSWLEQNREGVASVVGYLSLYLLALQLAESMMRQTGKVHTHHTPPHSASAPFLPFPSLSTPCGGGM